MASAPTSRRWSDMVEEEDDEFIDSEESSSRRSYSDVVRDGTPSSERSGSPSSPLAGPVAERTPPARQLSSVVFRPAQPRADGGAASRGAGGRRGPQPKRQRRREPLPSFMVPAGVSAGLAGLCFNCAEPGHVAGRCEGPRRCLNCKSETHIARQCTAAGAVVVGAPPTPPPPVAPGAPLPPRSGAGTSAAAQPAAPPVPPYRVPARQRLGLVETAAPPVLPRAPVKEWLGPLAQPAPAQEAPAAAGPDARAYEPVGAETPYERGLRREPALRAASPLRREEVARGETPLGRSLRREQELREAAAACRGVVAFVSGTRCSISSEAAAAAVLGQFPALEGHFSVHRFWPAEFLLVFDSRANQDTLLAANPRRRARLLAQVRSVEQAAAGVEARLPLPRAPGGGRRAAGGLERGHGQVHLGLLGMGRRLGAATASCADMGSFRITAWTDNPSSIPLSKELWLAEPLLFDDDDDDLLLPLNALIPEEVALLNYEATVHIICVEDLAARPPSAAGGSDRERDDGNGGGASAGGGSAGPGADPRGPPGPARGAAAGSGRETSSRRWRGGVERRVALVPATSVAPWAPPPPPVEVVVGTVGQPAATVQDDKGGPVSTVAGKVRVDDAVPPPPPLLLRWTVKICR
ncbi:hypothetical protein ACQ4PT_066343 [Festuca glaucescens]